MSKKAILFGGFLILLLVVCSYIFLVINGYRDKSIVSNIPNTSTLNVKEDKIIKTPDAAKVEEAILSKGAFNKIDSIHYASGDVNIVERNGKIFIEFNKNFSTNDGPDLFVYLSENQDFKNIAVGGVDTSKTLNVAPLKAIEGLQSYEISKEQFEKYNGAVIIWCKKFGVQFSRAELNSN